MNANAKTGCDNEHLVNKFYYYNCNAVKYILIIYMQPFIIDRADFVIENK